MFCFRRKLLERVGGAMASWLVRSPPDRIVQAPQSWLDHCVVFLGKTFLLLSPGQTIATCQLNISQHCWAQHVACVWPPCCDVLRHVECCWLKFVKPRPNDRNMPTQHIAALLGATCWVRLATVLRCVATCWVLLA